MNAQHDEEIQHLVHKALLEGMLSLNPSEVEKLSVFLFERAKRILEDGGIAELEAQIKQHEIVIDALYNQFEQLKSSPPSNEIRFTHFHGDRPNGYVSFGLELPVPLPREHEHQLRYLASLIQITNMKWGSMRTISYGYVLWPPGWGDTINKPQYVEAKSASIVPGEPSYEILQALELLADQNHRFPSHLWGAIDELRNRGDRATEMFLRKTAKDLGRDVPKTIESIRGLLTNLHESH